MGNRKDLLNKSYSYVLASLEADGYEKSALAINCGHLKECANQILTFASEYDYSIDVRGNGWRSLVHVLEVFGQIVKKKIDDLGMEVKEDEELVELSSLLLMLVTEAMVARKRSAALTDEPWSSSRPLDESRDSLFYFSIDYLCNCAKLLSQYEMLKPVFGSYVLFYGHICERLIFKGYTLLVNMHTAGRLNGIVNLFNTKRRSKFLAEAYVKVNMIGVFKKVFEGFDVKYLRNVGPAILHCGRPQVCRSFDIPAQNQWIIADDRVQMRTMEMDFVAKPLIRCRLMWENPGGNAKDALILFIHGGAFVSSSPDVHEIYTREWSTEIADVPIVAIDYRLSPEAKYPKALQQILDVYLWFTSGITAVHDLLGYYPKRIVLCGESTGSMMSLALCCLLNDIRKQKSDAVPLPVGIFGAASAFHMAPHSSPSMALSVIDPAISANLLTHAGPEYYATAKNVPELKVFESKAEITAKSAGGFVGRILNYVTVPPKYAQRPSLLSDLENFKSLANSTLDIWSHPYISPYFYDDMEAFAGIKLKLVVGSIDPVVDQSVMMARKWKGHVELEIFDGLYHDGLFVSSLYPRAKKMQLTAIEMIKDILNIQDNFSLILQANLI